MYRIIKVLNNNAILALDREKKREIILLGNGIGFGKHPGEEMKMIKNAKIYTLVTKKKQVSALKVVNGIKPVYIEATGRILEEADAAVILSESYSPECYLKRNDFMLLHSSVLIAYWDGFSCGGTSYTVRKALNGKRVVVRNLF